MCGKGLEGRTLEVEEETSWEINSGENGETWVGDGKKRWEEKESIRKMSSMPWNYLFLILHQRDHNNKKIN